MSGGGTNTVTSNAAPPAQYLQAFSNAVTTAQNTASVPYQSYTGNLVAPLSPDQTSGISEVENAQGIANPYINAGAQEISNATTPIWGETAQFSPSNVQQYESPYTSQVLGTTEASEANTDAQQQATLQGNAVSSGAWGGDRSAVAQGILGGQQALANNQTNAGIENAGYTNALGEFNTEQTAQLGANEANSWLASQAGYGLANLGQEAENTDLTGASALLQTGGIEQGQAQSELNVPYEQFTAAQAYPYQTAGWLANIEEGLGGASGGTSSTSSTPSALSQVAGLGLTGVGLYGAANNAGLFNSTPTAAADSFAFDQPATSAAGSIGDSFAFDQARGGAVPSRRAGGGISAGYADGGLTADTGSLSPTLSPTMSPKETDPLNGPSPGSQAVNLSDAGIGISVVPGASGLGVTASHKSDPAFKTSAQPNSTTTGGPEQLGEAAQLTNTGAQIAASVFGGPLAGIAAGLGSEFLPGLSPGGIQQAIFQRGGVVAHRDDGGATPTQDLTDALNLSAINNLDATMERGGTVAPFPHAHRGGSGIFANDNAWWDEPQQHRAAGGIAVPVLPTSGAVTTIPGLSGIAIPQLTGGPGIGGITPTGSGAGVNASSGIGASNTGSPALDNYLNSVESGASFAPPKGYVPPAPVPSQATTPAATAQATQAAIESAVQADTNQGDPGGPDWRGGSVGRHKRAAGGPADGPDIGISPDDEPEPGVGALPPSQQNWGIAPGEAGQFAGPTDRSFPDYEAPTGGIGGPPAPPPPLTNAEPSAANAGITPSRGGQERDSGAADEIKPPKGVDPWRALIYAGLGIMGGSSGNAMENIGRGALAGLKEYTTEDEAAKRLSTAADEARARLKETQAWHQASSGNQADRNQNTANYQAGSLAVRNRVADLHAQGMDETAAWHQANEELGEGKLAIAQQNADTSLGRATSQAALGQQRQQNTQAQGWANQAAKARAADALQTYRTWQEGHQNATLAEKQHMDDWAQKNGVTRDELTQRGQNITARGQVVPSGAAPMPPNVEMPEMPARGVQGMAPLTPPKVGDERGGYSYKGGPPGDPNSWAPVQ